jgi:drug/metabolite transporter (DMT)-like permease
MGGKTGWGMVLLITFLVSTSLRDVYLGSVFGKFGFFEVAFIAFGTATGCFLALIAARGPGPLQMLRSAWRDVLLVNVTTAVAWLSYFGSLRLVEPSVTNTVFSGVAPLMVMLFGACGFKARADGRPGRPESAAHVGLLGALVLLCWVVVSGRSGLAELSLRDGVTGLTLAAVSGTAITAETVVAKRMNEAGISPAAVLGARFCLVTLIAAGFVVFDGAAIWRETPASLGYLAAAALLLIVVPIYLVQAGLAHTSPMTTNVVLSLGPVFVFAAQALAGQTATSPHVLAAIAVYAAFAIFGNLALVRRTIAGPARG